MFNSKGEVNASNLQEALAQIAKYAAVLQDNQPSNLGLSGQIGLTAEQRDEVIGRALQSNDGKIALAQSMANPINF